MKSVTAIFGVSQDDSRAGVVTFSHNVEHSIKLSDHTDINSFNAAVDAIPLMGSITRIDKALRLTQAEMFLESNGARPGLAKILVLLTDGSQTASPDAEDPAAIAAELRNAGINLIVVGMGAGVNPAELAKIAGGNDKVFTAATFSDLLSADFMKTVQEKACAGESHFHSLTCLESKSVFFSFSSKLLNISLRFLGLNFETVIQKSH